MTVKHVRIVRKTGTSISVTIPADFTIFKAGEEVWVELEDNRIIISKAL